MYSIPHKQFAIPRGYPIFFSQESMSCKGGGNVTTSFSQKKGVGGYHFWVGTYPIWVWKHTPLSFPIQRVGGYMFNKPEVFACGTYRWYYGWNLFWWKIEGSEALNGINVYRRDDPHSAGFVIKAGRLRFKIRWSKRTKRLYWGFQ